MRHMSRCEPKLVKQFERRAPSRTVSSPEAGSMDRGVRSRARRRGNGGGVAHLVAENANSLFHVARKRGICRKNSHGSSGSRIQDLEIESRSRLRGEIRVQRVDVLNGLSGGALVTSLKPAPAPSSRTFLSGMPHVPRPAPPRARDVVMQ